MIRIEGLVLAAGLSSRMGTNKMLIKVNGSVIIEKTIAVLMESPISNITIVLGNCSNEIMKALEYYPVNFIYNPDYESGMSSSIKCGIKWAAEQSDIEAVLVILGDMPFIKNDTISFLIEEYKKNNSAIIVPRYKGRNGHPVLFSREMFQYILTIKGDNGAREVINNFSDQVLFLDVDDPGITIDLDTKQDIVNIFKDFEKEK
ncbi:MAG: nucleotidyltransferase family protein [Syntrophomonadaceae bacterium]|jgi:molybdenum cofactor cytidylyltransferase|nr:nucleotidyltransferase family protein [Syntrophomonadaceae bacterium]